MLGLDVKNLLQFIVEKWKYCIISLYLISKQGSLRRRNQPRVCGLNISFFSIFKEGFMRHCCEFKADEIYYLEENNLYSKRKLSVGFCPICLKPVAELLELRFDGEVKKSSLAGIKANDLLNEYKDEILYSMKECNYLKFKAKPYGWKYGINKSVKINGKEKVRQYACDFYGNKELIKTL